MSVGAVSALFEERFGRAPRVVASAPGRVNLIGEHTDYNGGEVLPIAIARRTWVALAPNEAGSWNAASATQDAAGTFDPATGGRSGQWWDYVAGVVAGAATRSGGAAIPACDAAVWSDVPAGAGLSSSAALGVSTAFALEALAGDATPDGAPLALAAQRAEIEYVGVEVGIMDQFASALGTAGAALHVWCDTARYEHVPMGEAVLIFDTAVPRALRASAYNTRRAECDEALRLLRRREPTLASLAAAEPEAIATAGLPDPLGRRAMHVSTETRRVRAMVAALRAGEPMPGDLLVASHASLRELYECSSPELDWFVDHATAVAGVRGARLTGAGWGGCAIAVGAEKALADAGPGLADAYRARFGHEPRLWLTRAEAGARVDVTAAH